MIKFFQQCALTSKAAYIGTPWIQNKTNTCQVYKSIINEIDVDNKQ